MLSNPFGNYYSELDYPAEHSNMLISPARIVEELMYFPESGIPQPY